MDEKLDVYLDCKRCRTMTRHIVLDNLQCKPNSFAVLYKLECEPCGRQTKQWLVL